MLQKTVEFKIADSFIALTFFLPSSYIALINHIKYWCL